MDPNEIAEQAVLTRQEKARTFLAGMSDTGLALCIDKTDLHYAWDTLGRMYVDLTSGGGALPMGAHHLINSAILNSPHYAFPYVSRFGETCLQAQVDYAQALSDRFPMVGGLPPQVVFTDSGHAAMNLAQNIAKSHAIHWANLKPIDAVTYEPMDTGRAQHLCELTVERGGTIVVDERITGFGRLGSFMGWGRYDLVPWAANIITVIGESGGGGIPFGAVIAPSAVMAAHQFHPIAQYGGNPLACQAGLKLIELQDGGFYDHVRDLTYTFEAACESLHSQFPEIVLNHQGRGMARSLLIGHHVDAGLLTEALLNNGVIAETRWDRLLLTPPLIMTDAAIGQAFDQIAAALVDVSKACPAPAVSSS